MQATERTEPLPPPNPSGGAVPIDDDRGRGASSPTEVPAKGWKDVLKRTKAEAKQDNAVLLAAGVAFFGLLAMVPALVAMVSIYGLVAEPEDIESQVTDALETAPTEVREMVTQQLRSITEGSSDTALLGLIAGVAVALWSASAGMKHLMTAINAAYDEEETRGFVKLRGTALILTLGAILFVLMAFAIIAFVPALLSATDLGDAGRLILNIVRWVVLLGGLLVGLAVLYRLAPDRDAPKWSWASPGAVVAAVIWLVGSLLFSLYTANFGQYNETYGTLGAVVVVMLWLLISALAVILGAEVNAELERQTAQDTTKGEPEPMGERGAYAADTVAPSPDE